MAPAVRLAAPPLTTRMPTVLLVGSDAHVLGVMRSSLHRAGFDVDTVYGAATTGMLCLHGGHDAIVVDHDAGTDELLTELSAGIAGRAGRGPHVLVTAENDGDATAATGIERLEKPLSLRYLVARLSELLGCFSDSRPG